MEAIDRAIFEHKGQSSSKHGTLNFNWINHTGEPSFRNIHQLMHLNSITKNSNSKSMVFAGGPIQPSQQKMVPKKQQYVHKQKNYKGIVMRRNQIKTEMITKDQDCQNFRAKGVKMLKNKAAPTAKKIN